MVKFELEYNHTNDYDNKITLEIRLKTRPDKDDYQSMLDAIDTLSKLQSKYLPVVKEEVATKDKVK